jgi:hypothetical protein
MTAPGDLELDARGRRLRAALAAVLVPDNAPEVRLVREWLVKAGASKFESGACPEGFAARNLGQAYGLGIVDRPRLRA